MLFAQEEIEIIDGAFKRDHYKHRIPVPLHPIREADAVWSWTVVRVIDLNQKQNLPLTHPQSRLIDVIMSAIRSGEINDYLFERDVINNENKTSADAVLGTLERVDTIQSVDIDGNPIERIEARVFNPESVIKYRVKEEWVFDKQTSTMVVRIIAIAPIMKDESDVELASDVSIANELPLVWIYYPALRKYLAQTEVFNWKNDGSKMSFDDFLVKRLFSSYIYKESNVRDNRIQDYAAGKAGLYESERIKNKISDYEQSLWEY